MHRILAGWIRDVVDAVFIVVLRVVLRYLGWRGPAPYVVADPPCGGNPAARVGLGMPYYGHADPPEPATFETTGGTLYANPSDISHGRLFNLPHGARITLYIGPATTPPRLDAQRNVTPISHEVVIKEGQYQSFELPAGKYWLLTAHPATITLFSCTPGAVTGRPPPERPWPRIPTPDPSS